MPKAKKHAKPDDPDAIVLRPMEEIMALDGVARLEAIGREMFGTVEWGRHSWKFQLACLLGLTGERIRQIRRDKTVNERLMKQLMTEYRLWRRRQSDRKAFGRHLVRQRAVKQRIRAIRERGSEALKGT